MIYTYLIKFYLKYEEILKNYFKNNNFQNLLEYKLKFKY